MGEVCALLSPSSFSSNLFPFTVKKYLKCYSSPTLIDNSLIDELVNVVFNQLINF